MGRAAGEQTPPDRAAKRPRRRALTVALYVALMAAAGLAGWQIYRLTSGSDAGNSPAVGGDLRRYDPESDEDGRALIPRALSAGPITPGGIELVDADPLDVAPPAGAERQWSVRRSGEYGEERSARYRWTGSIDAAERHYARALAAGGFSLLGSPASDLHEANAPRSVLVYRRGDEHAIVTLRKPRPDAKIVEIVLTAIRRTRGGG